MVTASHKHNIVNNYSDEAWSLLRDDMFSTHIRYPPCKIWKWYRVNETNSHP